MLDKFLDVAYQHEKKASAQRELTSLLQKLPNEELQKIASGETKLSYFGGDDGQWLDRFKNTPLFPQALELEKQELQDRMMEKQKRQERRALWEEEDSKRDQRCIQRKLLELQLAELESGGAQPAGEEQAAPVEPEVAQEAAAEGEPVAEEAAEHAAGEETPEEEAAEEVAEKAAAARMAASFAKMAQPQRISLRDLERRTVQQHSQRMGEEGKRLGRKAGAKSGGLGGAAGAGAATLAGGIGLAAKKPELFKGKGGKAALIGAGLAALGAGAGAGAGAYRGGKRGKETGEYLGRAKGHQINIRRRRAILEAVRRHRAAQGTQKQAEAMHKAAFGTAALAGLKGLGGALRTGGGRLMTAGKDVAQAARYGGGVAASRMAGVHARQGARAAGQWAKANPYQAAGLAGATGLGAGYTMG